MIIKQLDESKHSYIGETRFTLTNVMRSKSQNISSPIVGKSKAEGELHVRGEPRTNTRDVFSASFSGKNLVNHDGFFSTSDPFLSISRINEDGTWTVVHTTKHIENSLNPVWAVQKIAMSVLCNGDLDRPLKFEIFDFNSSGKHVFMGEVLASVNGLLSDGHPRDVIEPEKKKTKKGYVNSGTKSLL